MIDEVVANDDGFSRPEMPRTGIETLTSIDEGQNQTKFILFPKLAVELRLKIWRYAFADRVPQFVAVNTFQHDCCDDHKGDWCPRYTSNPPPSMVNVCIESRQVAYEEARKTDQLHFLAARDSTESTRSCYPGIIFNPLSDILYVPSNNQPWNVFTEPFPNGILKQVKSSAALRTTRFLALNLNHNGSTLRLHDLGLVGSLEEIIFVSNRLGDAERIAVAIGTGYLRGLRERRRTRGGSYGEVPDYENYPSLCRLALRSNNGIEIVD